MCSLFGLPFLGVAIVLVVWALSRVFPDLRQRASATFANAPRQGDRAEEILRGRLASGEIDAEEYESFLRLLKGYEA